MELTEELIVELAEKSARGTTLEWKGETIDLAGRGGAHHARRHGRARRRRRGGLESAESMLAELERRGADLPPVRDYGTC